jgi:hypothetical protein
VECSGGTFSRSFFFSRTHASLVHAAGNTALPVIAVAAAASAVGAGSVAVVTPNALASKRCDSCAFQSRQKYEAGSGGK